MARRLPLELVLSILVVSALAAAPAAGHVTLNTPNGGESLTAGDTFVVEWVVVVGHDTQNWDLWYSVSGPGGPWIPIATDLPPGDISQGAVHTLEWVVPNDPSEEVRVRVRQDNSGTDYDDGSNGDLSISADVIFTDGFESGGLGIWFIPP